MSSAAANAANALGGRRLSATLPEPAIVTHDAPASPRASGGTNIQVETLKPAVPPLDFSTPRERQLSLSIRSSGGGAGELSSGKYMDLESVNKKQLGVIKKNNFPELMRSICLIMIITGNVFMSTSLVVPMDDSEEINTFGSIRTMIQITGPLYFYYAGRQEALSAGNILNSFIKKTVFLMVPATVGLFFLVLPAAYATRGWNSCGFPNDEEASFTSFTKSYLANFKCAGFDWLWVLVGMYVLHLANVPFCAWVRRRARKYSNIVGVNKSVDLKFIFP
jgi:hypothetical protein